MGRLRIKKVTGKEFKPENYKTLDEFKDLIDELKAGGMESPTGEKPTRSSRIRWMRDGPDAPHAVDHHRP